MPPPTRRPEATDSRPNQYMTPAKPRKYRHHHQGLWGVVFLVVAAGWVALAETLGAHAQSTLLAQLIGLVFVGLAVLSLLSRYVNPPV